MKNHPIAVGFGVGTQPPFGRVRGLSLLGRALRADSLWTVDHFVGLFPRSVWDREFSWTAKQGDTPDAFFDWQVLLGHLARRVGRRAQLAVGVTEPIRRHPVLIAQAAMTLAHLARRAPILGIGAGERENIEPYGLDFSHPVGMLDEALQIIRLCFDSDGPFDFTGKHFRLTDAVLDLRPPPGRVPEIWVAAHQDRMLRLTGTYGDGWYPTFPMSPEVYAGKLAVVRAAAETAGRDPVSVTPAMQAFVVIGRTEADARRLFESKALRYASLLMSDEVWRRQGLTHPLGEGFRGMVDIVPQRMAREQVEDAIAKVPGDQLAGEAIWGTPEMVADKLQAIGEAGLRHVVLVPLSAMVSRRSALDTIRGMFTVARRLRSGG
ncbi:MAG: LLM class flavin-dependent oxidoreductase [Acidimicrobiia bacterium]|nr:LLM class flavin-dependent oxidoreductase [Acidimicrobiia bacterium]